MLDAHFMCGDGRCNENIALSAVHHVFHSEHNRVVEQIKDTLTNEASASFLAEWQLADGSWNGARLFQAAKFTTEMEYQHLAFEEFARTIQPFVNEFIGYDTTIDARISAEFAHAAYRFGHSMLNEEVVRFDTATGQEHSLGLIQAFLNPPEFFAGLNGGTKTPDEAAGGLLAGSTTQVGQHIDEFLVEALRNNLLGLPLDLATLNIARGRDTGLGSLNSVRADIFAATNSNPIFEPYESWFDFMLGLETQESIVNFVAAYGIHPTIVVGDTVANRRAAAELLVQDQAFMMADGSTTGVDEIDLWMGGLAEKKEIFGGMLGSTLNYIFELQMENLQNGDRFYYLHRLQGLPLLAALEGNSFSELIERNTTAEQLPANVFTRPSFTFDIEVISPTACAGLFDDPSTDYDDSTLLNMFPAPDCTIRYTDAEHALFSGRVTGDDFIHSGDGDDTVRGHGGNDRLEGGGGNDGIVGGEGDDIITDSFGDDVLKGGPGDDAIHGGPGLDLLMGNAGGDFVVLGSDPGEIFGGAGNDFLLGGDSFDVLFGDDGDDWIEGGDQADLVQGDGGNIFENDPTGTDGDDVIDAGGGNDDNLGEGGNDIIIFSEGTDAFEGMLGFDWLTHRGDPQAADSDLERFEAIPIPVEPLASRFEYVEGLSGWMHDDVLRGDGVLPEILQAPGSHALDAAGIAKITNLDLLLPFGTTFFEGNIILGGGGSDLIEGRGLNDIIDGDAWLNVQLEAGGNRYDSLGDLQADVFAGLIDPGTITIVREILWEAPGSDIDTAEFDGLYADYDITENPDGSLTVVHARGTGALGAGNCPDITSACDDGTDILFNIERLVFADLVIAAPCSDCLLRVTTNPAVPSQIILDGAPVDRWALDWVKVAPGPHTVCFSDVEGWQTPACETVNVSPGATTFVQGDFVQLGHLRVITDPPVPSTITIDGVPSNDWAFWSDVATGSREVCFGDVAGFDTPACQTVNVTAGALTTVTGTFTPNVAATGPVDPFGLLRVTTESSETGGGVPGEIIVDGVGLDRWALNWMKLTPGTYEVCFGDLQNFSAPGCEEVTVHDGQVTSVVGVYEDRGILRVETVTPRPSTITANSVPLNDWGVWTDLPVGQYTICFGEADGFTPACQVVDLVAGQTEFVQGVWP